MAITAIPVPKPSTESRTLASPYELQDARPAQGVLRTTDPSLGWHERAGRGLAIVNPLSYGVTNEGIAQAHGQTVFLNAMASGFDLITYDQRGCGESAAAGASTDWEELGADLWRVADAAGIERAVLYGVADAGYTVAHAAALQPERVLGIIFNFVPPRFVADVEHSIGVPGATVARWFTQPPDGSAASPLQMLEDFGIDAGDALALSDAWLASSSPVASQRRGDLISRADIRALLPTIDSPTLVIQPKRRDLFRGWGDAMQSLLPHARVVQPSRGIEALGAIHAFLAVLTSDLGREASRLSPELSATVESSEQSIGALRRIAVAVDDDLASGRAVELACRLGEAQNAEIALIHVIEVPYARRLDQPSDEALQRGERAIELGKAIVERHHLSCKPLLVTGRSVAGTVVRTAEGEASDLIVVSDSENRSRVTSGDSVVAEVLRRAPGKVLVNSARSA